MLQILDNGLHIENGDVRFAWFKLRKGVDEFYRCVALRELQTIPVSVREDYDLLGKQWGAVRGLHNAGVNFVYTSMGIYKPDHVGIVQYFGAAGDGTTLDDAAQAALNGAATVEAVMANFPQSKLGAPNVDWLSWYLEFITAKGRNIAVILGHPDPREGKRGPAGDGGVGDDTDADLAQEQNELLFRGLAKLRQNFVLQVLAEHIGRDRMTQTLLRVSEVASNVASRRKGTIGIGFNLGIPLMAAIGQSRMEGLGAGHGTSESVQDGASHGWGNTHAVGKAHAEGTTVTNGTSETFGESDTTAKGTSHGTMHSTMESRMESSSRGSGSSSGGGTMSGWGWNIGFGAEPVGIGVKGNFGHNWGSSSFSATSTFSSHTSGHSSGEANGVSDSTSEMSAHSEMHAVSQMHAVSKSESDSESESWGSSENWGESHAKGKAWSEMQSRASAQGLTGGFSTGLLPGISINRTWQTEDDVAERLTDVLRRLESLVNQASVEGGFMTNAFLFTDTEQGAAAADALVPQAFHGSSVPTPVLTMRPAPADMDELRAHAFSFTPWSEIENGDPFSGELWTRYATLMTASQLAALTAPGLFEEGTASTTMAAIPQGMGFYPNMPGDVVLGHQYSPETADLTNAQVRLTPDNLMHTMAIGDTGFGKSVAMIRMAYETTLRWKLRTVVLDFGAGWRSLLNAPGLEGHVNILQLWPDAVRPFRWNPLQIGRNIAPETQWRAFADVFGGIAQLGVKRQKQELLEALRTIYIEKGVLIDDPEVRNGALGVVQKSEAGLLGVRAGRKIADLSLADRQALAVHRSSTIGMSDLYDVVKRKLDGVSRRDTMLAGVLEGILFRMHPLVQGSAALQFAPGTDTVPVEDLSKPWGVTIVEGGMFLDDFGKAFLLGWTGWHLYMDMVARRVHEINTDEPLLQIFFEEANKIFVKEQGGGDETGGVSAVQRFADFFRDARKYKVRLHLITQAAHLIADDIISSCSNIIAGFIKNPKDKDILLSALARSEKGFRDEEWRRFLDDMPIGMAIGRFPYTTRREHQRPMLFRPLILDAPEPTDAEIEQILGSIRL
ncbi:MAG: serine-rich protein [Chloroflexota bacterium]